MKFQLRVILLVLIGTILFAAILFAVDNFLQYFTAKSDGSSINLEWKSITENNLVRFELERSSDRINFSRIQSFMLRGSGSVYTYSDENAFMKKPGDPSTSTSKEFNYRIKFIKSDDSYSYSNNVSVTHEVSGIQRTWGMIKEMFR